MRRINYKSDIPPLLLSLKVDEKQITVPECDFIVRFYIEGYEGRHYDCSHIGGVWSNCEPSEDGTKLVCYINNQRLGIGELCAEFHYISPDRRYSDGSKKSVVIIDSTELGVELVEDNGDAVTEAAIDVTLPFIYRTAYEIARDHGYTGTAEDFYSALASVVAIEDAEKKRVTAEIARNANEQERIENEENRLNAENERVNAEAQRVRNEAIRGDAESDRVEQEEDRKAKFVEITGFIATVRANEGNRESNELERQTNEDTRITEEAKRVEAEKKRAAEFEQQKLDLTGKIDRSGDEMGGDLIFTDNAGVSFRTSDGGAHTMFNGTDDVAKFTADNGDTFEFKQNETPNKNSSAVVVGANLYNALDMTLDSMGSALDGDAAYRAEAGDKIFNPDTCKIQRYNSTIGGFEDLCDPIEGKLYVNKMTDYIYRWNTKAKKMVFVGGVKAYTKEEADSRFAKLKDETQTVNVKELNANNFVYAKSMWIGDEGLLLGGDGNGHLTVEQDEVITDVTLNNKLATKADDVAYGVEWNNGQPTGDIQETTVKDATKNTTVTTLLLAQSYNVLEQEVGKKFDKTDITQSTGTSTTSVMSQKAVSDIVNELESQVIYDVTANNDGVTFGSLSALLSDENLSTLIPSTVRCGGMSIRFIQSSDNKYVQYRLMSDSWSAVVTNWQGVDDEPNAGSENLIKSGGVYEAVSQIGQNIDKLLLNGDVIITKLDPSLVWRNGFIGTDGSINDSQSDTYQFTYPIPVVKGQIVRAIGATGNSINIISEYNNKVADVTHYLSGEASGQSQIEYTCTASGYIRLCRKNVGTSTFEIISTKNCPAIIPEFSKLNYDIDDIYARLIGGIITKTEVVSTEWVQGYIWTNGGIVPQSSGIYYYSKQISVTKGDIIKFNHVSGQGINVISLFSSGGVYIEGVLDTEQDYSFECSQDGFVRVCCNNKDECEVLLTTTVNYKNTNLTHLTHIKVAEWNFGVFNNGVSPVGILDADVNKALPSIKHLLASLNADILIATECPQYVNRGQTLDTYTTLLEQFFQYHKYGSSGICIFSKYPFAVSDWVSPDGRTYQVGTISIGTTQIGFAAIHPRSASGSEAKQARITDMQAVISELSDYDKIIVSGDFNTYEDDELDCWRNSGFALGNCGYFGDINTYPNSTREWYIDNIVTKGFNIDYFNRLEDTASVSDHYPVLAKMTAFL